MAGLTKAQARGLIQQFIDDPNAALWSAANVDLVLGLTLDELWADVLDAAPWFAVQRDANVTTTSPGYVDVSAALSKRMYRLQKVLRNTRPYFPQPQGEVAIEGSTLLSGGYERYTLLGSQLWLFPLSTASDVDVQYSWRPPRSDALNDNDTIVWPDGYEMAYIYAAASRLKQKGERESGEMFATQSERSMYRMKAAIKRREIGPIGMIFFDSPSDWGG